MAYFKSSDDVEQNKQKWTSNLPLSINTKRRDLPLVASLTNYIRLPQKRHIIGRYHALLNENK